MEAFCRWGHVGALITTGEAVQNGIGEEDGRREGLEREHGGRLGSRGKGG